MNTRSEQIRLKTGIILGHRSHGYGYNVELDSPLHTLDSAMLDRKRIEVAEWLEGK
jgi:hypothetical protein